MSADERNNLPDENELPDEANDNASEENTGGNRRRRVRVKVRKKIRIKQKPSNKKVARKVAERAFWVVIVVGFIASLIIMIIELDVRDERLKQQKRRANTVKGQ